MSQTITVPTIGTATGFTATQSYTYDPLNRLQSMSETGGLSQTFDYDRYGNRIITAGFVQNTTQTPNTIQNQTTLADWYDQSTNKLKTANYDAVGNVIKDTAGTNQGNTFDYDAENKQVRYDNGSVSGGADYQYDGDGHRVKKVDGTGQATTIYVYDAMGQMVAEYATTTPTGSGGTSYLTADHLGTPRVITGTNINDANGGVKARHDYLPFGEEVSVGVGGRTTAQGYSGNDSNPFKFAQLHRDDETGLDYAQARYYSNTQGRFTSVDPLMASGKAASPQTWNRYAYCGNNPLVNVDPSGLDWWYQTGQKDANGNTTYQPEWHDTDPGKGYERWTDHADYVFQTASGWWVLDPNSMQADRYDTQEIAEKVYNQIAPSGFGIGLTHAQQDYWAGVGAGIGGPASWLLGKIASAGGVDTTSRDYRAGLLFGSAGFAGAVGIGGVGSSLSDDAASLGGDVPASTPVGRSGNPLSVAVPDEPPINSPGSVFGREYSGHAFDQMQGRGIPPSAVENTIRVGQPSLGNKPNTTLNYDAVNNLTVVTNSTTGRVVTVRQGKP